MKTSLLIIGKTDEDYLKVGIEKYVDRLKHYVNLDIQYLPDAEKFAPNKTFLTKIVPNDVVVLLDEGGKEFSSRGFADFIQKINLTGSKNLYFLIGGPYGFTDEIYARANYKISLSQMTFSHQMVRLIFLEQLYRAHTILKGENYHHD